MIHVVRLACAAVCVCSLLASPSFGQSRPVLRRADVRVVMTASTACEVAVELLLDPNEAGEVVHRLQLFEGARAELIAVGGSARAAGDPRLEGRTMVLTVVPDASGSGPYTVRYRVTQPEEWSYRCPIWVPTTPTDGVSRAVRLQVDVPSGTVPTRGSFPAFTWSENHQGTATIGHVPAFVRVPFLEAGHDPGWWARQDLASLTDATAIVALVLGTLVWVWRARTTARDRAPHVR
jgi:hypothetical protein